MDKNQKSAAELALEAQIEELKAQLEGQKKANVELKASIKGGVMTINIPISPVPSKKNEKNTVLFSNYFDLTTATYEGAPVKAKIVVVAVPQVAKK
jgi:seryl-tRNA synthetase